MIPPNFVHMSPHTSSGTGKNPLYPDSVSGVPGKIYCTFDPPDSEMHFSTLSVSACTLRTRFAVFGLPTLFFIALSCPLLYHQYSILSTENQLFHTEYPEMSVIFPFHRASRTMSDSDSQKRINAFRQIHLFDIFRVFT